MPDGSSRRLPTIEILPVNVQHDSATTSPLTTLTFTSSDTTATAADIANRLPQLAVNYHRSLHDALQALQQADAALRRAREAFSNSSMNIIDLTNPSSDAATAEDFARDTRRAHQTNPRRPVATQTENAIFPDFIVRHMTQMPNQIRLPGVADLLDPTRSLYRHEEELRRQEQDRHQEERAIQAQAEARRNWQRTYQQNQQRAQAEAQSRHEPTTTHLEQQGPDPGHITDLTSEDEDGDSSDGEEATQGSVHDVLAQQQAATIADQNKSSITTKDGETSLNAYKCAICMDSPTQATTTVCGHLFCRQCILDSLKWSEQNRRMEMQWTNRQLNGRCPVCRKTLQSKETTAASSRGNTGGIVPLEFKKVARAKYAGLKKQKDYFEKTAGKGKERADPAHESDVDGEDVQLVSGGSLKRKRPLSTSRLLED